MADLGQLEGLEARVQAGHSESPMIDGKKWDGAKAYKDSKVCNMLTMGELHRQAPRRTPSQLCMLHLPVFEAVEGMLLAH